MILICYEGSPDAKAAIEHGATLLKGEAATVLTVWQPFAEILAHTATFGIGAGVLDVEKIDDASRKRAEQQAEEGARLAGEAGLDAHRAPLKPRRSLTGSSRKLARSPPTRS